MKKLFLMALTMLSSIGAWAGTVTIPTAVGSYISTAEATLSRCYSETNGKDIGSTHNGSTMTMSLNNTTAGDYFLQFLSGAQNLTATIDINIVDGGGTFNKTQSFNIANTGSWTPSEFHAMELKDLPTGDLTLTLTVISTTGDYAGNYGSFVIRGAEDFIDLAMGTYSGGARTIDKVTSQGGKKVGYCSNNTSASYLFYAPNAGNYNLCMAMNHSSDGTMHVSIADYATGTEETSQDIAINSELCKGYSVEVPMAIATPLTAGLKKITLTFQTSGSFLMDYENVRLTRILPTFTLINAVLNGGTTVPTVTGTYAGSATAKTEGSGYKFGSGCYVGLTLADGYTFQKGDVLHVNVTTENSGGSKLALYKSATDSEDEKICVTDICKGTGDLTFTLTDAFNGLSTFYLYRSSTYGWNGYVASVSVEGVAREAAQQTYSVAYSLSESGAVGTAPAAIADASTTTKYTVPVNTTLYKAGYTLKGWTDGENEYLIGESYDMAEGAHTLTPVFTQNTETLSNLKKDKEVIWYFGKSNGVPEFNGSEAVQTKQVKINNESIDLAIRMAGGDNSGRNDEWMNNQQKNMTVPVCAGAIVETKVYYDNKNNDKTCVINGENMSYNEAVNGSTGNVKYIYTCPEGVGSTIDVNVGYQFLSYIKVTYPGSTNPWANFEDFALDMTNGAYIHSDETSVITIGFKKNGENFVRCAADDEDAIGTLTGKFHSNQHGLQNFKLVVAVPGNVKIEAGTCDWGGDLTIKKAGVVVATVNTDNGTCYHPNTTNTKVVANYTGEATILTIEGGNYMPYIAIERVPEPEPENPEVIDGYTFTWTTNDGNNTSSPIVGDPEGYKSIRVSTVNPLFALKSTGNSVYNDSRFKSNTGVTMALVIPSNAIVSKVEFLNCSENYYKYQNDENRSTTTTFTVASAGATVAVTDKDGAELQYLSAGQTITATLTNHVAGTPITFVAAGGEQLAYSGIKIYYALTNKGSLSLISQSASNNAVIARSGRISLTFDNNIEVVNNAAIMINGQAISTEVVDASLVGYYNGLQYGQNYTITLAANSVKDPFGNIYTEDISVPVIIVTKPTVEKAAFDAIVSNGTELAAAIAAANARTETDQSVRYRIFIKPGAHVLPTYGTTTGGDKQTYPDPRTTITASNVSIIGADYNTTSFTNITPEATWDNGYGQACPLEGIGAGDVLINKGTANYFQGVMIRTSMGDAHGRDIAFNDQGKKTIFKDAALWGYQDTYVSNNSNDGRFYFEGGLIRGRTDYLCGKGDVYYNQVTLQCVGTGALIAVPSLPTKYGYIFKDCHIVKETQDVTYNFGRPWGKGTPIALFIDTKVDAAPIEAGWDEMVDGWPDRFAEYNTYLASDNSTVSTANRKHTYASTHECNPILTAAEAAYYSNLTRILSGNDGWDPSELTEQVAVSGVALNGAELTWDDSDYALCWVIFKDGEYYANVTENTLLLLETGDYTVRAANAMGGLGAASAAFHYDAPSSYTREVPTGEYGTICLPYDAFAENAVVMSIKGTTPNKSGVVFEYVDTTEETSIILKAGRPYLYRATADVQTFTCDMSSQVVATPIEENKFVGTYEKISPLTPGLYFLYSDNLFHPAGSKISIGAYRCYFNTSNVNEIADATSVSAPDRIVVLGTYNPNVTGVENTECNMHSTKCIVNGKIVIRRGDRTYSILGQRF